MNAELYSDDILALLDIPAESEDEADAESTDDLGYSVLYGWAWCKTTK